ncbi:MAG: hypothetical protein E7441_00325 [Ruminococcaceae bacterium]|nr:hypothetical protein [Oscillospiraceae bacterium]
MQIYVIEKLNGDFRIDFYSGTGFEQDRRTLHSHPYHEFSLISDGDVTYTSNKCVDRVDNEHCFIFSAAYQLHNPYINQEKKYERYQIMFNPDFVSSFLPEYSSIFSHFMSRSAIYRVPDKIYRRMLTIMETLYDRFENAPPRAQARLNHGFWSQSLCSLQTMLPAKTWKAIFPQQQHISTKRSAISASITPRI